VSKTVLLGAHRRVYDVRRVGGTAHIAARKYGGDTAVGRQCGGGPDERPGRERSGCGPGPAGEQLSPGTPHLAVGAPARRGDSIGYGVPAPLPPAHLAHGPFSVVLDHGMSAEIGLTVAVPTR
jgi:hypothetical protein